MYLLCFWVELKSTVAASESQIVETYFRPFLTSLMELFYKDKINIKNNYMRHLFKVCKKCNWIGVMQACSGSFMFMLDTSSSYLLRWFPFTINEKLQISKRNQGIIVFITCYHSHPLSPIEKHSQSGVVNKLDKIKEILLWALWKAHRKKLVAW